MVVLIETFNKSSDGVGLCLLRRRRGETERRTGGLVLVWAPEPQQNYGRSFKEQLTLNP